jgi:hypothetical protein
MKGPAKRKCLCCQEFYRPDHRNLRHQRYCSKAACRKESKAQSQRRWQQRPENQNSSAVLFLPPLFLGAPSCGSCGIAVMLFYRTKI